MSELRKHSLEIAANLPIQFYFEKHVTAKNKLLIFLHGYTDSAASFLRRAYEGHELDFDYLAPNAPFPVPVATDKGFKEAYSWYFEDHAIGRTLIAKEVAIKILVKLISELGLESHQKTIIGFSQGGFLAPKLAEKLTGVEKIIGIGCDYRKDLYENIEKIRVFGIHGKLDQVVDYQKSYNNYVERNFDGEFATLENMGHKITEEGKTQLSHFILK